MYLPGGWLYFALPFGHEPSGERAFRSRGDRGAVGGATRARLTPSTETAHDEAHRTVVFCRRDALGGVFEDKMMHSVGSAA